MNIDLFIVCAPPLTMDWLPLFYQPRQPKGKTGKNDDESALGVLLNFIHEHSKISGHHMRFGFDGYGARTIGLVSEADSAPGKAMTIMSASNT